MSNTSTKPVEVRRSIFAECFDCGERWKVATIPMEVPKLVKLLKTRCPNCGQGPKKIGLCPTEGKEAVTEARNGKAIRHEGDLAVSVTKK
jgi:hypothetical protein